MGEAERGRLVENIAGQLAQVTRESVVQTSIEHFRSADPEYGARIEAELKQRRAV